MDEGYMSERDKMAVCVERIFLIKSHLVSLNIV